MLNGTIVENVTDALSRSQRDLHPFDILQQDGELIIMCVAGLFMVAFVLGNLLHSIHVTWIPESFVVIMLGIVGAVIWRSVVSNSAEFNLSTDSIINQKLLNMLFLPIIIFEAGWSMRNKEFLSQLPYILTFAVFGTVIAMLVVAGLTIATRDYHSIKGTRTAFAYGALIAAVDPVATLSTYAHLNVEPLLNILVMGESIINDAVAIVLFEVLNDKPYGWFSSTPLHTIILDITKGVAGLLGFSILIGLGLGAFYTFVLRFARMRNSPHLSILFIVVSAYFTFHFADDFCGKSGIIAVLFSGMIMSATATPHLSVEGALLTSFLLKQLASLADMSVFVFVGFAAVFTQPTGLRYCGFAAIFCLVGRALATFPLAGICNCIKMRIGRDLRPEQRLLLTWRHTFMMWHAGLRGGIALVLTLSLGDWVDHPGNGGGDQREVLRNATVLMICVFLLVFGGSTEFFLKTLKIPIGNPPPMFLQGTPTFEFLYYIHRKFIKPTLKGTGPKDKLMQGSILKSLFTEAKMTDRSEIAKVQAESGQLGNRMELFGRTDPIHLQRGWTRGDANQEGWFTMHRRCCGDDTSTSEDESGESSGSDGNPRELDSISERDELTS